MSLFKIARFPGFQQGHESTEYELRGEECVRVVTDNSKRKPESVSSIAKDAHRIAALSRQLAQIDWLSFLSDENRIFVDDVDLYLFEGDFGKVSVPLEYALEREGLHSSFKEQCELLFELVQQVHDLEFIGSKI